MFEYAIPSDTFWDSYDGFNLTYVVDTIQSTDWLSVSGISFIGVPLASDVSNVAHFRVYAINSIGVSSPVLPFAIVAQSNVNLQVVYYVGLTMQGSSATQRRGAGIISCPADISSSQFRANLILSLGPMLSIPFYSIDLLSFQVDSLSCVVDILLTDNAISTCSSAATQVGWDFISTFPTIGTTQTILDVRLILQNISAFVSPTCTINSSLPLLQSINTNAHTSASRRSSFFSTALPVILIAGCLLVLGCLGFYVLRRVTRKKKLGINETFFPREPIFLNTDRMFNLTEYSRTEPVILGNDLTSNSSNNGSPTRQNEPRPPQYHTYEQPQANGEYGRGRASTYGPRRPPTYETAMAFYDQHPGK